MQQRFFSLAILMLFLLSTSCQQEKGFYRPPVKELQPDTVIDAWGDSIFLDWAYHLHSDEENLYISDVKLNRILALTHDLHLERWWGRAGKGPGEFLGAADGLTLPQGGVAVLDLANKRINHFAADGSFVKAVVLPDIMGRIPGGWSMDSLGNYYLSSDEPGGQIFKLDPQGKVLARWSAKVVDGPFNQCYHLSTMERGDLLAAQVSMFMLEKHHLDGTLVETLDLRDHPQFDRARRHVEANPDLQDPKRAKLSLVFNIRDAKYLAGKLFILVLDAEEDKIGTN